MAPSPPWYQAIRDIHDRHFHDPWEKRAEAINRHYGLSGEHRLLTHGPGIPLPWFIGDVDAIDPGRWVLAISLNHQIKTDATFFRRRRSEAYPTADSYWDYCRTFNLNHCYPRFFGPLAQVAAAGLGQHLPKDQVCGFAAGQMIFTEICPYGSNKFNLGWPAIKKLLVADQGFQLAWEVNQILIEDGQPALVMVNGSEAVNTFQHLHFDSLDWRKLDYDSCDAPRAGKPRKRLWHWCGLLRVGSRAVPIVGFPFLRKPFTHNSGAEVAQLGAFVRQCVELRTSN